MLTPVSAGSGRFGTSARIRRHRRSTTGADGCSVVRIWLLVGLACVSMACSSQSPSPATQRAQATAPPQRQPASGEAATPAGRSNETRRGLASFIAKRLDGQRTASGEVYDSNMLVAAHPTYPMGTVLRVTNHENGRVVEVKAIDRSASGADRPIIDLSRTAAERLDFIRRGTVTVPTEVVEMGAERPAK
jgi:rare lipoprotein A